MSAFGDGLPSVDQAAVVATRMPAHNDCEACELALYATVAQLRRALSKRCFPPTPKPSGDANEPPPAQCTAHHASAGFNDTGEFFLHALADQVDGALIMRALAEAKDALFRPATSRSRGSMRSSRSLDGHSAVSRSRHGDASTG